MRVWVIAAAMLVAAPASAQDTLDGKATVDDFVGSFVKSYVENEAAGDGRSAYRSIIAGVLTRGMKPEDRDLFLEFASGKPVQVTAAGSQINVPALDGDVLAIARLHAAPPNLNTLWKQFDEPTAQMIEMSRWGKPAKDRIVGFMTNKLYAAWLPSNVGNSHRPWVSEFTGVTNALDTMKDPSVRREGKLLLKAAMEQMLARAKTDGVPLSTAFLYNFYFSDVGQPADPQ